MKRAGRLAASACAVLVAAAPGAAASEAVLFEGTLTHGHWLVGGDSGEPPPSFSFVTLGETRFSGRFVLDPTAPDADPDPKLGSYAMEGGAVALEVEIGGSFAYETDAFVVDVRDDTLSILGGYDGQVVRAHDVPGAGVAPLATTLLVAFGSWSTSALAGDALVPPATVRDALPVRFLSIQTCAAFEPFEPFPCTAFEGVSGAIDLVQVVPEADAAGAAAAACAGLAALRRGTRRRLLAASGAGH